MNPALARSPRRRRRVLVVDDNLDAAVTLADVLVMAGHEVALAHDGSSALRIAGSQLPDAILCDIGLPGVSGYDVARVLRLAPAFAGALLVAVTGYGSEEDVARARESGFDVHLQKPVDPDVILALLQE